MKTLRQLEDCAQAICDAAKLGAGAEEVEVRIVRRDGYGYDIRNRELAPELSLGRVSVGLRALKEGGLALAATSSLDVEENVRALKVALTARQATPLTKLAGDTLEPGQQNLEGHDAGWEVWAAEPERLRTLAAEIRDRCFAADSNGQLQSVEGGLSFGTSWMALGSSRGLISFKRSHGGLYTQLNSAHYRQRYLARAPTEETLESLRDLGVQTLADLREKKLSPQEFGCGNAEPVSVILAPTLLEGILRNAGAEKFLGSSRNAGLSALQAGQAIWDPKISLWDSGVDPELATGRPCDDELHPTQETALVDAGKFAGLVWSRRSATEAGGKQGSTGNGYRAPMLVEEPSEAPVRDKLSGLVMNAGERSKEAMLAGCSKGLYLIACLGLHGADKARASFSTTVYDGFAIENGKIVAQLAPGRWNVAGQLFPNDDGPGLFGKVQLSSERELTGSARLPWLRTELTVG